jgi:hypothetical protein
VQEGNLMGVKRAFTQRKRGCPSAAGPRPASSESLDRPVHAAMPISASRRSSRAKPMAVERQAPAPMRNVCIQIKEKPCGLSANHPPSSRRFSSD